MRQYQEHTERHPFQQCQSNGKAWKAGHGAWNLCAAWNFATNPARPMTEREHERARVYARAIRNRMEREGVKYIERSNGSLWPIA